MSLSILKSAGDILPGFRERGGGWIPGIPPVGDAPAEHATPVAAKGSELKRFCSDVSELAGEGRNATVPSKGGFWASLGSGSRRVSLEIKIV